MCVCVMPYSLARMCVCTMMGVYLSVCACMCVWLCQTGSVQICFHTARKSGYTHHAVSVRYILSHCQQT